MKQNVKLLTPNGWSAAFISVLTIALVCCLFALPIQAQTANREYRAYWAETFNTPLGTRADVVRLVDAAVASNANAIFAQVRRRGDSWYLDSLEPLTQVAGVGEPVNGQPTIDPLRELIREAHARGIEVHAYVIVGAIYNAHPTITGLPRDDRHVFNQHFWDKTTNSLIPFKDARQWSTRSLPHNTDGVTFDGQRYAAEWYVDLGHPDAAAYTSDVLTHLVENYDVDGLHLDRIRYPEAPIDRPAGQPLGINTGYNETSVNRFKARYGDTASYYKESDIGANVGTVAAPRLITAADVGYPKTNDPKWNDWRREQVTNFVRRVYLNATRVKPQIKVSAALICFWTGPVVSGGWQGTESYYRVFQDWQAWTREGTLDIIAPMIYKQEHTASLRAQFDDWLEFSKTLARDNNRHSAIGLGNYLNGIEGTLRQARRALARPPFDTNNTPANGVIFYALGDTRTPPVNATSTSAAVTANPYSYPTPGVTTPKRTNPDFYSAVTTGASADGQVRFEDPNLVPLFPSYVGTPEMTWKTQPVTGYAMGFVRDEQGAIVDGAVVTIKRADDDTQNQQVVTDGGGFYGFLKLTPGAYQVTATLGGKTYYSTTFNVAAGEVAVNDLAADAGAPVTTATLDPTQPNGANNWYTSDVTITLSATDALSGVTETQYSLDNGQTWQPYTAAFTISSEGANTVSYRSTDRAGNVEAAQTLTVKIDKSAPQALLSANPSRIFSPNGKRFIVSLSGTATDTVSGLASVSYTVTDEYGDNLAVAPRTSLEGTSAMWTDTFRVEARRDGSDKDGRLYRVTAVVTDNAGNTTTVSTDIIVLHDRSESKVEMRK